ncbi:MAG: leader peptidase (prepilin peptidase) / N-methyltransferase [Microgenomates group bacterium LiPW_16]|nr:MAG: leader peptidase (prepilin peptidase) / N-methyltransferase [Microgenomates group bacterium LiPW_16]
MFYFFSFLLGLAVGSFLNVLIYRLPHSLSLSGRSFCPKCKKKIFWQDNIPLLSFILLRGRCRFCHSPISWRYPLVELATGILTVYSVQHTVHSGENLLFTIYYLLLIYALIVVFVSDLKYQIIPDQIVYPVFMMSFVYNFITNSQLLITNYLISALAAGLFFYLLFSITGGRGMGLGDVKLAALMGLFLGFPKIIIALYLAFLTGAIVGVILVLVKKKKFGEHIPFGPFLSAATIISLFFGKVIWEKLVTVLL